MALFAPTLTLARFVRLVVGVVCVIIVLAIIFVASDASTGNTIVSHVNEWANTLTAPFHGIFHVSSHKGTIALNYGLAVVVYAIAGELLVHLLAMTTFAGGRRRPLPY
jgi:hypothetical protein